MNWEKIDSFLANNDIGSQLLKERDGNYALTDAGFDLVTRMLEDCGYFPNCDMEGFEPNKQWAGIMGTYMLEAAGNFMRDCRGDKLDEDQESILALVGLYAAVARTETEHPGAV